MRLCGFLGHDCLLCNRSLFNKKTEAESPDDHCHLLLRDGPADIGRLGGRHMPHVVVMAHGTRPLSAAVCADGYLILQIDRPPPGGPG
jgi:hypothetical protein